MKIAICITLTALLSGCSLLSRPGVSADGLGAAYLRDATNLARVAADELARRYPPAHTQLTLTRAPGAFGDALEHDLRTRGYAITENTVGVLTVQYTVDELDSTLPNGQRSGYVRIRMSDGQEFSFMRKLNMTTSPGPLPLEANLTPEKEILAAPLEVAEIQSSSLPPASPAPVAPVHPAKTVKGTPTKLSTGVLSSLPSSWRYTIPDSSRRTLRVSKPNLPWRDCIQSMAEQAGCAASFDENARRVTIIAYDDAPLPSDKLAGVSLTSPSLSTSAANISLPTPSPATTLLPLSPAPSSDTSSTPIAVSSALNDMASLPPPLMTESADPNALTVLESKPIEELWTLSPGSLFEQLSGWCDRAGYQLVWKASHDLDMEAQANFRGSFSEAVGRLFQGLHKSGNALRVTLYTANSVMEISEE